MSSLLLQISLPFLLIVITFLFKCIYARYTCRNKTLPPSPPKLPIIGNLHQLGSLPHRSLWSLSKRYGELMLLHLGCKPTLVVSSANAAQQIMKIHDIIFSNRPKLNNHARILYDGKDIGFANYGEYWKQMRGICVQQLLSTKKVQSFRAIREEEAALMVDKIKNSCSSEVNLRELIMTYTNDVVCRASFGKKYANNNEESIKFMKLLNEAMKLIGDFSLGDCIPWLGWIDQMTGLTSKVEKVAQGLDEILQKIIEENQNPLNKDVNVVSDKGDNKVDNFVEILVEFGKDNNDALPIESIKAVILDMFAAGTDTTSTLIEWAIIELIRHQSIMKEVKDEVGKIVKGRKACEDDLEKMTYLKAVIKETLRIHPPGPLLIMRESSQDVKLNDFDIAAGTQVIINAWAIQRDPFFWDEPEEFHPERFLKSNSSDFKGQDFNFIPFGAGRRICPGMSFGLINVELVIATLMHEFDWKLPIGVDVEELDMTEIKGLTVHRRDLPMFIATPYRA